MTAVKPIADRITVSRSFDASAEEPARLGLKARLRKHPRLLIGLGAVALAGVAAVLGRGALAGAARPWIARAVRPHLIKAAARRPLGALRLATRHPRTAARLVAAAR